MTEPGSIQESELVYRRLIEPLSIGGTELNPIYWLAIIGPVLLIGLALVVWMYIKDSKRVHWYWAAPLALLRVAVYLILTCMFLLPAREHWERSEKRSRVLVVLDVSDSMQTRDGRGANRTSRAERILDLLADDKGGFVHKLLEQNPVYVYRFGSRLDEESQQFEKVGEQYLPIYTVMGPDGAEKVPGDAWVTDNWKGWANYDFRSWLVRGVSQENRAAIVAFLDNGKADKILDAEWAGKWLDRYKSAGEFEEALKTAFPEYGSPNQPGPLGKDLEIIKANRLKLPSRLEVALTLAKATSVPESVLAALSREEGNMVQGIVVFSDGRSTGGSEAALQQLRARAENRNIPIFTVVIGENIFTKSIRITDLQVPSQAPPDEPFKAIIELDGDNMPGERVNVRFELAAPPEGEPVYTVEKEVEFDRSEPPHAQAEFIIDPDKMDKQFKSESTKGKELTEGRWKATASTAKINEDGTQDPKLRVKSSEEFVKIEKKPVRVLMMCDAPTRDFQFLLDRLLRDKADVSVYVQNAAGTGDKNDKGQVMNLAYLDNPNRHLMEFPNRIRVDEEELAAPPAAPGQKVPEQGEAEKWLNLARYDVIIAFDPDWSKIAPERLELLQTWVDANAGGLMIVAGPVHLKTITRGDPRYNPLLEILPVVLGDYDIKNLARDLREPRRLSFDDVPPDAEFLKLDESAPQGKPTAGWNTFFFGKEDADPNTAKIARGFYNYYPVKEVKPGALIAARYVEPAAREGTPDKKDPPYIVTLKYGQGWTMFMGSSEIWRLRGLKDGAFFERFWVKSARYLSQGGRKKQDRRGRILMSKAFPSGGAIRTTVQLLDPSLQPLPATAEPKMVIRPVELDVYPTDEELRRIVSEMKLNPDHKEGDLGKKDADVDDGPDTTADPLRAAYHRRLRRVYTLQPKKGGEGTDAGYFQRQVAAVPEMLQGIKPNGFPTGVWEVRVPIPSSSQVLREKFSIRKTNPELDNIQPDEKAMAMMASKIEEVTVRLMEKPALVEDLKRQAYRGPEGDRLMFKFDNRPGIELIPQCMQAKKETVRNRAAVEDLWDKGFDIPRSWTNWYDPTRKFEIAYLMLAVVVLLSVEWLTRKLLKLA